MARIIPPTVHSSLAQAMAPVHEHLLHRDAQHYAAGDLEARITFAEVLIEVVEGFVIDPVLTPLTELDAPTPALAVRPGIRLLGRQRLHHHRPLTAPPHQ